MIIQAYEFQTKEKLPNVKGASLIIMSHHGDVISDMSLRYLRWLNEWKSVLAIVWAEIQNIGKPFNKNEILSCTLLSKWKCYISFDLNIMQWLPWWLSSKKFTHSARGMGSIPGSGRSLGEVNGSPLQYSCLGNPMDREVWWSIVHVVTESDITQQLNNDECMCQLPSCV